MTDRPDLHVGDYGIDLVLVIRDRKSKIVDISSATEMKFLFQRPSGSTFYTIANLYTDGKDGKIKYQLQPDDLDESGEWKLQGVITSGTSSELHADIEKFNVGDNITLSAS